MMKNMGVPHSIAGVKTPGEFFGVSLQEVSPFNIYIALYANYPEWLAGVKKEYDLPRRVSDLGLPFQYVVPNTEADRAILAAWIVETCHGVWNINNRWVSFGLDIDAVHYKLRWT